MKLNLNSELSLTILTKMNNALYWVRIETFLFPRQLESIIMMNNALYWVRIETSIIMRRTRRSLSLMNNALYWVRIETLTYTTNNLQLKTLMNNALYWVRIETINSLDPMPSGGSDEQCLVLSKDWNNFLPSFFLS